MKKERLQIFILLLALISVSLVYGQKVDRAAFITDSLDAYIRKGIKDWKIPGLALAIIKDGKIIHSRGYGVTCVKNGVAVTENTLFQIASITKSFTATTATILQEEGKLSLDDKVSKWLPYFKLRDSFRTKEADISDLLSHRLGFTSYKGDLIHFRSRSSPELVVKKMASLELDKKFRASYGYSNAAYTAVGEIISKANGKTWARTVQEKILAPLKMENTLLILGEKTTNMAKPHTIINDTPKIIDNDALRQMPAAGSMISNVRDMSNWLLAQLADGKFEGEQRIPIRAIKLTRNPYNLQGLNQNKKAKTHFYAYGLGYFVRDIDGFLSFQHSGGISGFSANHILVPEKELGIVVLSNNDTNSFYLDLTNEIVDAFMGFPFKDYSDQSLRVVKEEKVLLSKELNALKARAMQINQDQNLVGSCIGTYQNEAYGTVQIVRDNESLKLKLSNQESVYGLLSFIGTNKFLCEFSNPEYGNTVITFTRDKDQRMSFDLLIDKVEGNSYVFIRSE